MKKTLAESDLDKTGTVSFNEFALMLTKVRVDMWWLVSNSNAGDGWW